MVLGADLTLLEAAGSAELNRLLLPKRIMVSGEHVYI